VRYGRIAHHDVPRPDCEAPRVMELRVAAYGIVTGERGLLLAHWRQGDRSGWTLPGGGIDPGEHPADAVRREVEEETGYLVSVGQLLGVDSHVIPAAERAIGRATDLHALRIVYRAEVVGGELRHEVAGSTDQAGWFSPAEVDRLDRVPLVDIGRGFAGLG